MNSSMWPPRETIWLAVGFVAQALFAARFLVQWIVSERRRQSVVPLSFWFLSLAGGCGLLMYSLYRRDAVFVIGQAAGILVYARNLWLIRRAREAGPSGRNR